MREAFVQYEYFSGSRSRIHRVKVVRKFSGVNYLSHDVCNQKRPRLIDMMLLLVTALSILSPMQLHNSHCNVFYVTVTSVTSLLRDSMTTVRDVTWSEEKQKLPAQSS